MLLLITPVNHRHNIPVQLQQWICTKAMMLKRLGFIVLALILTTLPFGCITASNTPTTKGIPTTMPDDFYIIYEVQYYTSSPYILPPGYNDFSPNKLLTLLNTKDNVVGESCSYRDGPILVHNMCLLPYHIPRKGLQDIYAAIIEYDIISYCGPDIIGDDSPYSMDFYRATFCINGEIYQVIFSNYACSFPEINDTLGAFLDILNWEVSKGIPRPY